MNTKKKTLQIVIVLLILLDLFLLLKLNQINIELNNTIKNNSQLITKNDLLKEQVLKSVFAEKIVWADSINVYSATDSFSIKELIDNENKLVLWFSELSCRSCVDAQYQILVENSDNIKFENIVLLTSSKSTKIISPFKRINEISKEVFSTKFDFYSGNMTLNSPCYFIMGKNLEMIDIFYPEKDNLELTESYFEVIKSKYFSYPLFDTK